MKAFMKQFFIWLLIFTIILVPARYLFDRLGKVRVFSGSENLMDELGTYIDPQSPFYKTFNESSRVNMLLLGINDDLSDTIMLGSYDMKSNHVDVISIPRDTYYYRPEAKSPAAFKINAIYRKGTATGTAKAVSDLLFGIPIHYYAVVDYKGVGKIVDAVGGVPVDIPFHMYYKDPADKPPLYIDIPPGPTIINSGNVQEFLRFRKGSPGYSNYSEGDIGRIKAHQEFIKSAFKESIGIGFPKIAKSVIKNVDSDLNLAMALKIAGKAAGLTKGDIETWLIPGKSGTKNGLSYWWADGTGIRGMIEEIYEEDKVEEE